jgi:hypothetical protein
MAIASSELIARRDRNSNQIATNKLQTRINIAAHAIQPQLSTKVCV